MNTAPTWPAPTPSAVPGAPTHRLFFALFPGHGAAHHISRLARQLREGRPESGAAAGRPQMQDRFHVTLHHLGDHPESRSDIVSAAKEAASSVDAPAFTLCFDRVMSFARRRGKRPWVLRGDEAGLAALQAFQQTLGLALERAGLGCWVAPTYTPHLTLLYDERVLDEQPIEPIGWTAHEFVLVESLIGRMQYVPLQRWSLQATD